jgi:two-component system phosphate regulon response regulator PhoB
MLRAGRFHHAQRDLIRFHRLVLDVNAARLTVADQPVALRPRQFRLIEFLVRHPERVFSRQHLLEQVWGRDQLTDLRAVDISVQRARRALAAHGCAQYLQTVRSVGYRMSVSGTAG